MKKIKIFVFLFIITGVMSCEHESENVSIGNGQSDHIADEAANSQRSNGSSMKDLYAMAAIFGDQVQEDPKLDIDNSFSFETMEEYREFIEKQQEFTKGDIILELETPADEYPTTTDGCADGIYSGTINAGMATLKFDVVVSSGKITSVSGGLTGWSLGLSYTQGAVSISGSTAVVTGSFNYNVFLEGAGTIYSQATSHTIKLPC
jgi:hypothetical protein